MKVLKYTLFISFIILCSDLFSQYEYPGEGGTDNNKPEKKGWYRDSKLFFGGVPGLMFGSVTYIELPPYVGYKFTPYIWAGLGPLYMYYKDHDWGYETNIYGGKAFVKIFLIKNLKEKININLGDLFLYGESTMYNMEPSYFDSQTGKYYKDPRIWINETLIGIGFRYPIGYRSGFSLNILWDITQNPEYYNSNPVIKIGFDL